MNIYLYGPSGSGKSTIGKIVADVLNWNFVDLDEEIEKSCGKAIPNIFQEDGEQVFRQIESERLQDSAVKSRQVISLGGGALLMSENRETAENSGEIIYLFAELEDLVKRLSGDDVVRPLLVGDGTQKLENLLKERALHYASFPLSVDTTGLTPDEAAWKVMAAAGKFYVRGMGKGYDVIVQPGIIDSLGQTLHDNHLSGPIALVSDANVYDIYGERAEKSIGEMGYQYKSIVLPAGERFKSIDTVEMCWNGFLNAGLERGSTVVALGGGVMGDMAGFAAATYLRGVRWVNVPTTLLAMVDSSLGGKTGVNLSQGKNLVGAFHAPAFVLTDPNVLNTLPVEEMNNGMGEVIKHGVILDVDLFNLASEGWSSVQQNMVQLVRRAVAVKVKIIEEDPYESGIRMALNLGHTIGHGVEFASAYNIKHGEAVAIGMVAETGLAEKLHIAEPGLKKQISDCIRNLGLPVDIPADLDREVVRNAIRHDKKKKDGSVRFALPERVGSVRVGIDVGEFDLR